MVGVMMTAGAASAVVAPEAVAAASHKHALVDGTHHEQTVRPTTRILVPTSNTIFLNIKTHVSKTVQVHITYRSFAVWNGTPRSVTTTRCFTSAPEAASV